ncbi:MAG TPA: hypothetical protein VGM88_22060 [Kofleriaceae bacterium]
MKHWLPVALFAAACGSGSSARTGDDMPSPPDAMIDGAPDAAIDAAIDAMPDAGTPGMLGLGMTGTGDVAFFQNHQLVATCNAACLVALDPALPTDVYASSIGTFVGFDGVAGPVNQGGGHELLAAGATHTDVAFSALPGERWIYLGASAAFDASGNLAIEQDQPEPFGWGYQETDVYDPTYTLLWSSTTTEGHLDFDAAGNLYTIFETGGTNAMGPFAKVDVTEFDPTGALLSSGSAQNNQRSSTLDAAVLGGGGVATPVGSTLAMYSDALTTSTASATLPASSGKFCLGVDGDVVHLAGFYQSFYADAVELAYALDGTSLGDDGGDWDWCQWGHNTSAGNAFVGLSESQGWVAHSANATVVNSDSWEAPQYDGSFWSSWPYNAAATDLDGNLYYQESPPQVSGELPGLRQEDGHGLRLRKYVDNTGVPVATVERDAFYAPDEGGLTGSDYYHLGISVQDISVAPDGRVALTVWYIAAGADFNALYVIVLPPM